VSFEYGTDCEWHSSNQPTLTNTFGMVFSTTWLEFKDMAQDPLVRRETVSASCNRRPDEGRLLGSQCRLSTGLIANGIRLTKRCNALSSRSDVTRGLPDLGMSFTSTNTFGMVFSTTWLEFKDMAQDPLVRQESVSDSCNRRPHEGLETQKYSLSPQRTQG
jgi:hypothetical protein